MERKTCPYLGLPDDENTSLNFPSDGNVCYRANPAQPASHAHQSAYCLTGQHAACPVFLARTAGRMPSAIAAPQAGWRQRLPWLQNLPVQNPQAWKEILVSKRLDRAVIPAAILLIVLVSGLFGRSIVAGQMMSLFNPLPPAQDAGLIPNTAGDPLPPAGTDPAAAAPQPQRPTATTCPIPQGWQPYTVQPTDSLFRISILYGTSLEALQKANCMEGQTYLAAGSILFVPALNPTATSAATFIPTLLPSSTPPIIMNIPPPTQAKDSGDTPKPATAVPPTSVPPTSVPPTSEPPTAVPPTSAPPAKADPPQKEKPTDKPKEKPTDKPKEKPTDKPKEKTKEPKDKGGGNNGGGNGDGKGGGHGGGHGGDHGGGKGKGKGK